MHLREAYGHKDFFAKAKNYKVCFAKAMHYIIMRSFSEALTFQYTHFPYSDQQFLKSNSLAESLKHLR